MYHPIQPIFRSSFDIPLIFKSAICIPLIERLKIYTPITNKSIPAPKISRKSAILLAAGHTGQSTFCRRPSYFLPQAKLLYAAGQANFCRRPHRPRDSVSSSLLRDRMEIPQLFSFTLRRKGGGGWDPLETLNLRKTGEINLRKTFYLKNLEFFYMIPSLQGGNTQLEKTLMVHRQK